MIKILTVALLFFISIFSKGSYIKLNDPVNIPIALANNHPLENINPKTKPFDEFAESLNVTGNTDDQSNNGEEIEGDNPQDYKNEKVLTYNIKSDKIVGEVPEVAVKNSEALIPCSEVPEKCNEDSPTPSPKQTPTKVPEPTTTPTIILPSPTITPEPTITIYPFPTIYDCPPPPPCYPNKDKLNFVDMPCRVYPDNAKLVYPCPLY